MASSLLDELPCLLNESNELIARLSFFLKLIFSPPATNRAHPSDHEHDPYVLRQQLASVDVDAIARSFSKHVFMASSSTSTVSEKLNALLPSAGSPSYVALQTLAAKVFHLMKRVYQWQQTTWDETLMPFFVANSSHLTFDRHRLLTSLVLTSITKSVKLHLLWSLYPNLSGILVLHSYLESKKNVKDEMKHEQKAYRPLDFVLYFGSNPLVKIQQELQQHALAHNVARNMLELILSCFDSYVKCHDLAHLKNDGVLFEVDASVTQGTYASSPLFQDLLVLPQLVEWVLCVALCLPHQWKSEPIRNSSWQLWDFVQLIAQDRLIMVVARDLCVNIHDLLFQQLTSALSSTMHTVSGSGVPLQPLKKMLMRLSKQTVKCGGERRRERRALVLWFLRDCTKLLRHNGGLAAPLFPRLLAVMALAQDELEWLLSHHSAAKLAPGHVKTKHMERAGKGYKIDLHELTELLALYHELRTLLAPEGDYIRRYYTQFIARGDADAIATEIQRFLTDESRALNDSRVVAMLRSFTERKRFQLSAADTGFASWRREWQQLSVYLLVSADTNQGFPIPTSVSGLLDRACRHANYVQAFEPILERVSSVSTCFWFQEALDKCSHEITKADSITADTVIVPVVLNDLSTGRAPVEELIEPSEANQELGCLGQRVELLKLALGNHLQCAIDGLIVEEENLHARLSPLQMIERMGKQSFQSGVNRSAKTTEMAATAMLLLTPGTESRLLTTPDAAVRTAQPLAAARSRLCAIVSHMDHQVDQSADSLGLRELVQNSVQACIMRFLCDLLHETYAGDGKFVLRCSWEDGARQWCGLKRCLIHQFQSIKWASIPQLLQSTLTEECKVGTHGADRSRLMDRVLALYTALLESKCVATSKSHLTLIAAFAPSPNYLFHRSHRSEMDPAMYASPSALRSMEKIVGRDSMQAVRRLGEEYVVKHTKKLFECLERDKIALIRLKLAFPEDQSEIHMAVRIMEALDNGIVHELLCVGNGAFFLQILDTAMSKSSDTATSRTESVQHRLRALWASSEQGMGDVTELPSHIQTIWNLLPYAFVATFYGTVWTKTKYVRSADATTTNVHLLAPAMTLLVEAFEPRGSEVSTSISVTDQETQRRARIRHVAHIASQAVLSLRRVSADLPTPGMVAVAKYLLHSLASSLLDEEMHNWLPDCIQEMNALAA